MELLLEVELPVSCLLVLALHFLEPLGDVVELQRPRLGTKSRELWELRLELLQELSWELLLDEGKDLAKE